MEPNVYDAYVKHLSARRAAERAMGRYLVAALEAAPRRMPDLGADERGNALSAILLAPVARSRRVAAIRAYRALEAARLPSCPSPPPWTPSAGRMQRWPAALIVPAPRSPDGAAAGRGRPATWLNGSKRSRGRSRT